MVCRKCGKDKNEDQFSFRSIKKNQRRYDCKDCCKIYARKNYAENDHVKSYYRGKHSERVKENIQIARSIMRDSGCIDCGNSDIRVLEFDHVSGKKDTGVMQICRRGASVDTLMAEIAKCEVRCLNCHRIATYMRAGWSYAG